MVLLCRLTTLSRKILTVSAQDGCVNINSEAHQTSIFCCLNYVNFNFPQDSQQTVSCALFQNAHTIVTAGTRDGTLKIWDLRKLKQMKKATGETDRQRFEKKKTIYLLYIFTHDCSKE